MHVAGCWDQQQTLQLLLLMTVVHLLPCEWLICIIFSSQVIIRLKDIREVLLDANVIVYQNTDQVHRVNYLLFGSY